LSAWRALIALFLLPRAGEWIGFLAGDEEPTHVYCWEFPAFGFFAEAD
jgi:hypothetical protein